MQVEVLLTGIGGQGIQLSAKTLALAATIEGRQAMLSARYGGEVRGGQSEASVVIADKDLRALPILPSAWSAYVMHHDWWEPVRVRLRPGGVVVVNSTLVRQDLGLTDETTKMFTVPATEIATASTGVMTAGFVLLGAYVVLTGLVSVDGAVAAMRQLVPPYRTQHLEANEVAIRAGAAQVPALAGESPLTLAAAESVTQ